MLAGSLLLLWFPKRLHVVSTPFKTSQGDYERLLENIKTLSRTNTISGSICSFAGFLTASESFYVVLGSSHGSKGGW